MPRMATLQAKIVSSQIGYFLARDRRTKSVLFFRLQTDRAERNPDRQKDRVGKAKDKKVNNES